VAVKAAVGVIALVTVPMISWVAGAMARGAVTVTFTVAVAVPPVPVAVTV